MLTFRVETLAAVRDEAAPLLRRHWEEIALNRDTVPLDPDWQAYDRVEAAGLLHITTARNDAGGLVGYAVYFVVPNLHYRSLRVAETDIFWLVPEHRRGLAGLRLLRAAEAHLAALGVNKIVSKVKLHHDTGPLFERLGYTAIERVYAKMVR